MTTTTTVTAEDVVRYALSQLGYHEGSGRGSKGGLIPGPPWNNFQKYSHEAPGLAWSDGYAWCCTFCSATAYLAGAGHLVPCTASVAAARDWYKARGQFSHEARLGSQMILGRKGDAHTGWVTGLRPGQVRLTSGNSNDNGSAEGDGVYSEWLNLDDPFIYGYGHPKYDRPALVRPVVPAPVTAFPKVSLFTARKAARHGWRLTSVVRWRMVTRIKAALKAENCPTYADWQKRLGYTAADADGIPGHDSLTKLGRRHGFRVTP